MSKELVSPNLHVILIHFPLGVFVLGMVIELLSFLYRRSPVRTAGRFMILAGALLMIPAATSGMYAFADVARRSMPPGERADQPWGKVLQVTRLYDGKTSEAGREGEQWRMLEAHAWRQGPATIIAAAAVVIGLGCSDRWRRKLYWPLLAVLVFALAVMAWGAWYGGEMVYRHGTGVRLQEQPPAPAPPSLPTTTTTTTTMNVSPGAPAEQVAHRWPREVEYYVPPLQTHVILGGFAIAVALLALGLSARAVAAGGARLDGAAEDERMRHEGYEPGRPRALPGDLEMFRTFRPAAGVYAEEEPVPAARWWLVAFVVALLTSLAGWWFLANTSAAFARARDDHRSVFTVLWEEVSTNPTPGGTAAIGARGPDDPGWVTRRLAHTVTGGAIVVLPLVLAAMARWARRQKALLAVVAVLLLLAVAGQVWLGALMLYDTPGGTIYRFQQVAPEGAGAVVAGTP